MTGMNVQWRGKTLTLLEKQGPAVSPLLPPSHPTGAAGVGDNLVAHDIHETKAREGLLERKDTPVDAWLAFPRKPMELVKENGGD
jgi:hypothetical protein